MLGQQLGRGGAKAGLECHSHLPEGWAFKWVRYDLRAIASIGTILRESLIRSQVRVRARFCIRNTGSMPNIETDGQARVIKLARLPILLLLDSKPA